MAERRMFAKTIVLSDAFLDLPMSARCLYFTLGMLADDDGFVNAPRSIMRQCGASDDDMKILLSKKFVLLFDSGVIVIKHWRINNYLRSDRYTETKYADEKAELSVEDNGAYRLGIPPGIPKNGIPPGIPRLDKESKEKDSLDQVSKGKGECEGENPAADSGPSILDGMEREKQIDFLKARIDFYKKMGWNISPWLDMAAREGITAEELNA